MQKMNWKNFKNALFVLQILYLPLVFISKELLQQVYIFPMSFISILEILGLIEEYKIPNESKIIGDNAKGQWDK